MQAAIALHHKYFTRPFLCFYALLGLVFMLMLNWAEGYRAFIYLNVLIALVHIWTSRNAPALRNTTLIVLAFPLTLSLLHMVSVGELEIIKEIRHLFLAGFVCLSVIYFCVRYMSLMKPWLPTAALGILVLYCVAQVIALYVLDRPYGTAKNPHYLALYSALGIPVSLCLWPTMKSRGRIILVFVLLTLSVFVLHTWSRPIWIALILSGLLMMVFLDSRKRLFSGMLLLLIPLALFLTNTAGFGNRVKDLALNIHNEERVVIWQDAWHMQQSSSPKQWLIGHGLDSYEEDFRSYSRYQSSVSFNSPHNSFLELTYTSGILGLAVCTWLYYWIYRRLCGMAHAQATEERKISLLLMAIATINLLFIMITIPFVSHYNMYTLAFVVGLVLYYKLVKHRLHEH